MNYNRGSIWRKWDLHVHTPISIIQHYGGDTDDVWEKYISDLEALPKEYSVLGINDYLFIDGYEKLYEARESGRLQNIDLLLPVVEFRIEKFAGIDFGNFSRINFHVIFDELHPNLIRRQFLNTLDQSYVLSRDDVVWKRTIDRDSLIDLGSQIRETTPAEKKDLLPSDLVLGFNNLNLKENQIFDSLDKDCFEGKYLTAVGKTEWAELKWKDASISTKKDIINKADFVFTAVDSDEQFYKGKRVLQEQNVNDLLLDCSDAHYYSDSDNKDRIGNSYTWIKADPSFEGLKQILFEPELRVRIQKDHPELSEKKIHISKFSLSNNTNFPIVEQEIDLNRDLVSIIGGRGSGKSAFIETIAFCFNEHKSFQDDKDVDEWDKLSSENDPFIDYYLKNKADFDIELNFMSLDGEPLVSFKTSFQEKDENCSYPILYLGQNRIEYFANDSDRIHSLAYNTVIKNSSRSDQLNQYERTINEKREKLINLNKEIEGLNEKIKEFNEADLIDEKRRIVSEKELFTSKEVKATIQTFNESRGKREALKNLEELIGIIGPDTEDEEDGTIIKGVMNFISNIAEPVKRANELAKEIGYDGPEINIDLEEFFRSIENVKESIPKEQLVKTYRDSLADVEKNLKGKTDLSVSYLESLRSKESIIEDKISNLERLKANRIGKISDRYLVLDDLESIYSVYNTEYQKAIDEFSERNEGILKSIRLESKMEFDTRKLVEKVYKEVDRRKVKSISKLVSEYLKLDSQEDFRFTDWIKEFKKDEANLDIFTDKSPELFDSLVFEDYFNLITNIGYQVSDGEYKSLDKLSLGQKGTVLLKFYLSSGNNCPILIDQPEDHLDNDFIYSDLVETIRNAKKKRQIIIVTHDANLVVNGDSEQVIIARYSDEKIDHALSGSLENPEIRGAVARILEGGDEAFKKREQKYSFK